MVHVIPKRIPKPKETDQKLLHLNHIPLTFLTNKFTSLNKYIYTYHQLHSHTK